MSVSLHGYSNFPLDMPYLIQEKKRPENAGKLTGFDGEDALSPSFVTVGPDFSGSIRFSGAPPSALISSFVAETSSFTPSYERRRVEQNIFLSVKDQVIQIKSTKETKQTFADSFASSFRVSLPPKLLSWNMPKP